MVGVSLVIMKCPRHEIHLFTLCGQKTFCIKMKNLDQKREGKSIISEGFICALECVNCMNFYILQLLYFVFVIVRGLC